MPNAQNIRRVVEKARVLLATISKNGKIPESLEQLILHPRNRRVTFNGRKLYRDSKTKKSIAFKSFVVDKNLTFDGITRVFKQVIWSSYAAPAVRDKKQPSPKSVSGCYGGGTGKHHGTKVHQDFERMVKVIRGQLQRKNGNYTIGQVDPCAYRMFTALINRKIIPLYAEYVIFDEYSGLATAIDCLAWDVTNNEAIAIEIKTGHASQYDYAAVCGKSHFRQPHEFIADSPLNRAATQLLMSLLIIARRYGVQVDRGIIIRPLSTSRQVQMYDMPAWSLQKATQESLYAQMRGYVTSGANTRRIMKRTGMGELQRLALERQESRRSLLETGADPSPDVFWVPSKKVIRIPKLNSVLAETTEDVAPEDHLPTAQFPELIQRKRKVLPRKDACNEDKVRKRKRTTNISASPSTDETRSWCNTMISPTSTSSILTTKNLAWRNEILMKET